MHRTKSFEAQILCYLSVQFCMWMTKLLPYHTFVLSVNHICKEKKNAFCSTKIHCKISSPLKRRFLQYQSFGKSYAYAVDKVCETIEVVYRVSSQTIAEESDSEKANLFLLTPLVIVKLLLPYALVLVGLQTMANLFLLHVREERLQWYTDLLRVREERLQWYTDLLRVREERLQWYSKPLSSYTSFFFYYCNDTQICVFEKKKHIAHWKAHQSRKLFRIALCNNDVIIG